MLVPDFAQIEQSITDILQQYEQKEAYETAYQAYQTVEKRLLDLPESSQQQRLLAQCLMREANMLRSLGQVGAAQAIAERELAAARQSQDSITLARSLFSFGVTLMANQDPHAAEPYLQEARTLFESSASPEHQQGLGWYWIIRADFINAHLQAGTINDIHEAAENALRLLKPLHNWRGVARAYEALAKAYAQLPDTGLE